MDKLSISLESIMKDQREDDSCTHIDPDLDLAAANNAADYEVNTSTVPYPSGLGALTQTATNTKPADESEARDGIRSIIEEHLGPLQRRACYFEMQANGMSKALNATPVLENTGSYADHADTGQEDGPNGTYSTLTIDIIQRLTVVLGRWSRFQFEELCC